MNRSILKMLLLLTILCISKQILAFRCGSKLVNVGDNKYKVAAICGEPDFKETRAIRVPSNCIDRNYYEGESLYYRQGYSYNADKNILGFPSCQYKKVDIWVYNLGPRKFMRELTILHGAVKKIRTLDYGY